MRFLVDECIFGQIVDHLTKRGHDVVWARTAYPGRDDEFLLAQSFTEGRIIVTEDRDFGELTIRFKRPAIGIVIVAVSEFAAALDEIGKTVGQIIDDLGDECYGHLTVIEPGRIRQRPLHMES